MAIIAYVFHLFTILAGFYIHPLIGIGITIIWIVQFRQWNKEIIETALKDIEEKNKATISELENKYGKESIEEATKSLEQRKALKELMEKDLEENPYLKKFLRDVGIKKIGSKNRIKSMA